MNIPCTIEQKEKMDKNDIYVYICLHYVKRPAYTYNTVLIHTTLIIRIFAIFPYLSYHSLKYTCQKVKEELLICLFSCVSVS